MWVALFLSSIAFASASDSGWKALLHFDGAQSSALSSFFLSPEGDKNPQAEWDATLAAFRSNPKTLCRFPARALYFRRQGMDFPEPKDLLCERYHTWKAAIHAQGIELIFAAGFLNSPSSMYGHSLLKFVRGGKTEGQELLDYTLNYGADTKSAAGAAYVWLGLTGGFNGFYTTAPFYIKVREYNDVENRDFWIYPLNLSRDELELLVAHAWELRDIPFPYYFFRRNCAYFLLEYLEVARPGQRLTSAFPFWAVPLDTIRRLQANGWLKEPRYRPSRYRVLEERKKLLSREEQYLAKRLATGEELAVAVPNAAVLDAAYELFRYRKDAKKEIDSEREKNLLRARAQMPEPASDLRFNGLSPEHGHKTSKVGVSLGQNRVHVFSELTYRPALHDILARGHGYEEYSELSMGDVRVRIEEKVFLERFDVLRTRSLAPRDSWIPRTAWSLRLGGMRAKEFSCTDWRCLVWGLSGGAGQSFLLGPLLLYGLAEVDMEGGSVFGRGYRFAGGPTLGLWTPLWTSARILLEGEKRWRILGEEKQKSILRLGFSQDLGAFDVRWFAEVNRGYREGMLQLNRYF